MVNSLRLSQSTVPQDKLILKATPLKTGIVHLGLGNFHRAHLSVYTAKAMQEFGGEWGILAYSIDNKYVVQGMSEQDNLYSVVEIGPDSDDIVVPGIHTKCLVGYDCIEELTDQIANPDTKIVSLTVTEAGYYISQRTNTLNFNAPEVMSDLEGNTPKTIFGIFALAIKKRVENGAGPFTIMSCDNVVENGDKAKKSITEFLNRMYSDLKLQEFVAQSISFPNSMVDRIVPGLEGRHKELALERLGVTDEIPVPAEKFTMWALEDNFIAGRPDWEKVGVIMTSEVEAFELMKLRLLNGAHSLLAYLGGLNGHETIPGCRFDPLIERALHTLLFDEYLPSVQMPSGLDAKVYIDQLYSRWANTRLGDKTYRVGTDGSTKLPQRITEPALLALKQGRKPRMLALTTAGWLACISPSGGFTPGSIANDMADPFKESIRAIERAALSPAEFIDNFFSSSHIFSDELSASTLFTSLVKEYYLLILSDGVERAIAIALA